MKKYNLTFDFFDTEIQANKGIERILNFSKKQSKYLYNKNKNIHFLNWSSFDNTEHKKIVWYYI